MSKTIGLTNEGKNSFLKLARNTISFYLSEGSVPSVKNFDLSLPPISKEHLGVFVTINKNGNLRGCIGYVKGFKPLEEAIIDNTLNAAIKDPRFPQVSLNEIEDLRFEISILSPITEIKDINEIKVGTHGLIISSGFYSGLLLPQVATEWNWTRQEFLEHTCQKAGLHKDAWKENAKIEIFSAVVFSEE